MVCKKQLDKVKIFSAFVATDRPVEAVAMPKDFPERISHEHKGHQYTGTSRNEFRCSNGIFRGDASCWSVGSLFQDSYSAKIRLLSAGCDWL